MSVVSPETGQVRACDQTDWGIEVPVDLELGKAQPNYHHALVIPGGVINSDKLRLVPEAVSFVKALFDFDKAVFVICHGLHLLIEASVVK